jgi:hypothetical protein
MMNISNKPSHLFAATVLGAVLCASFAPAHAGLLGGSASGGLMANGRVGGQLGADSRGIGPAARTISHGAERTAGGLGAQGAAQSSVPGGTQGSATGAASGGSTALSGSAINTPTSSAADTSLRKEAGTVQGSATSTQAGRSVDASSDASLKAPTRTKR